MANGEGTKTRPKELARLRALPENHPKRINARVRAKKWRENNPERAREHAKLKSARARALPKNHPSRIRARKNAKKWAKANPERVRANAKRWREENVERLRLKQKESRARRKIEKPHAVKQENRSKVLRRYSLTIEQWNALFASQDNKCAICPATETPDGRWHTDHDDDLGPTAIRGILCVRCNIGLGQFKHDPELLMAAVVYLHAAQERLCSKI